MSFGSTASTTPKEKKLAGLDPTKVNSSQRATPVPYFAGQTKLGVTWIGQALRQKAKKVKDTSESKGGGASGSHKYYCDLAAMICHGVVDVLVEVWMDDHRVWEGNVVRAAGQDSATITIEDRGVMTLYWGTETQGIDPLLAGAGHTAYRGQCYAVFNQLCLGQDTQNAPNVEFVLKRQPPTNVGLLTRSADINQASNAVHIITELLTNHRFGGGFDPATTLDTASLRDTAEQLAIEALGLSVQITEQDSARGLLTRICEYIDGWIDTTGTDLLRLRLARSNPAAVNTLPLIGEYDLLDVPEITPQKWGETFNQVGFKFTNSEQGFQDDSVTWYDTANLAFTGVPRATYLDRPWIDRISLAQQLAAYNGRFLSVPQLTAKLSVRKEAAEGLDVGDFLRFTYADFNTTVVMRVLGRSSDKDRSQAVTLQLEADRYFDDVLAYTPEVAPTGDVPPVEPEALLYGRVIELPYDLAPVDSDRTQPQLAAVGARASGLDVKLKVFSSEDGFTFNRLTATRDFALYGTLATAYSGDTPLLDNGDGILITFAGPDSDFPSTTEPGWLRQRLLLFIDDEILAYRDALLVGANQVRFQGIRRACSDTVATDHAVGAAVLMLPRNELCAFTDETYDKGAQIELKLPTATARGTLDLTVLNPLLLTLTNRTARPLPPINLRVNDDGIAPSFTPKEDSTIAWDAASWRRHDFFDNWDEPFTDQKLMHKIKILGPDGTMVRKLGVDVGVSSYVYTAADRTADMGTDNPDFFTVQVFSRRRGIRSALPVQLAVTNGLGGGGGGVSVG